MLLCCLLVLPPVEVHSRSFYSHVQLCASQVFHLEVGDAKHVQILREQEVFHDGFFAIHALVTCPPTENFLLPLFSGDDVLYLNSATQIVIIYLYHQTVPQGDHSSVSIGYEQGLLINFIIILLFFISSFWL